MNVERFARAQVTDPINAPIRVLAFRARRTLSALKTPLGRPGLRHGVDGTVTPQPMLRRLQLTLVLDIGANRGPFALDCLQPAPGVHVISIDPQVTEAHFIHSTFRASPHVELVTCTLGDRSGVATRYMAKAHDSSSLLPIGPLPAERLPTTSQETRIVVPVHTFDDAFQTASSRRTRSSRST